MSMLIRVIVGGQRVAAYANPENAVRYAVGQISTGPNLGTITLQKFEQASLPLQGKRFWVDAGHGGSEPGAHDDGAADGIDTYEKYVNLDVATKVAAKLRELGAEVFETRTDDTFVSLSDRTNRANAAGVDFFLSVHYNAHPDPAVHGIETFVYLGATERSYKPAREIHQRLISATDAVDRGVKEADFHVLRETAMAAALVEYGFLTNDAEERNINDPAYRAQMVQATVDGLVAAFRTT